MKVKLLFLFCVLLVIFNAGQTIAEESVVLSGDEVIKFLSNHTITVSEVDPDQQTNRPHEFNAYFWGNGGARALGPDGQTTTLAWGIEENGALCVRNYARYGGEICGFVVVSKDVGFTVKKHKPVYSFYMNDRGTTAAYIENDKVVFDPEWRHFLTFSNIREGEQL